MHTRRGGNNVLDGRVVELANTIGKRTSRVHHSTALDSKLLAREEVLERRGVDPLLAVVPRVRPLVERGDLALVGDNGAVLNRRRNERNVHTRVVVLAVVVDNGTHKPLLLEHGERLERLALAHPVRALHVLLACEDVVQLAPGIVVRQLPPGVDWEEDGEHVGEMGCSLEEDLALAEGLLDELPLLDIQLHDRLLEVSHTAVDELCGL